MSSYQSVERDERTVAVENASYRWAYSLLAYALLIDVMYRAIVRHEAAWDMMALVVAGGAFITIYQARHKTLVRGWRMKVVIGACLAALVAVTVAVILSL